MDALDKIEELGWNKNNVFPTITKSGGLRITVIGCPERWNTLVEELKGVNKLDLESDTKLYDFQDYAKENDKITIKFKLVS